ncbi:hypothetical protein HAX54_009796, partial [Datura stramonium]|nr:hypothetical protein [Datura stramonium]
MVVFSHSLYLFEIFRKSNVSPLLLCKLTYQTVETLSLDFLEDPRSPAYYALIPKPPPRKICSKLRIEDGKSDRVSLMKQEIHGTSSLKMDMEQMYIITDDGSFIPAHYTLLVSSSISVFYLWATCKPSFITISVNRVVPIRIHRKGLPRWYWQSSATVQSKNGIRCIKIPGVPHGAVSIVIRFLYSACYEEREMKKFVLHLLVLSHSYSVPSLKRVFIHFLEHDWLSPENVIDVLQLGRNCDAPQLIVFCIRMIVRNFKTISTSEGWKVMRCANPMLEQELLKSVVEADSYDKALLRGVLSLLILQREQERGWVSTIGPRDQMLKTSQRGAVVFRAKNICCYTSIETLTFIASSLVEWKVENGEFHVTKNVTYSYSNLGLENMYKSPSCLTPGCGMSATGTDLGKLDPSAADAPPLPRSYQPRDWDHCPESARHYLVSKSDSFGHRGGHGDDEGALTAFRKGGSRDWGWFTR